MQICPVLQGQLEPRIMHEAPENRVQCCVCKDVGQYIQWRVVVKIAGWNYSTEAFICDKCRVKEAK